MRNKLIFILFLLSALPQYPQVSWKGKQLIIHFETKGGKPDLVAYRCPAGLWTISYGIHDASIKAGMQISLIQAEQMFTNKLLVFEKMFTKQVKVPLTSYQYDGFYEYVYNRGSFYPPILQQINLGRIKEAFKLQLTRDKDVRGHTLDGLSRRRGAGYYLGVYDTLLFIKYKGELK